MCQINKTFYYFIMIKIKKCKKINNLVISYFNTHLFDITDINMKNKKLFIIKNNINDIIGSFFIDTKHNILDTLFIIKQERGKGYCSKILDYIKNNYLNDKHKFLYVDVATDNTIALKCYSNNLKYIGILSHELFYDIYKHKLDKKSIIHRYVLIK